MWSITWYNCQLLSHYSMSVFSKREDFELTCKSLMIKVLGFCSILKQFKIPFDYQVIKVETL